ncbi:hypothetical protein A1O3_01684 [Capronia epimyces CBS 606.96]|uniref:Uncharacterized protein n=1 Tax=Capronia epimyces CBS 606.96 TaxID=1182542 RepID=W9YJP3_9EURO|nr:uncharacterized protein A1O3_01684 [Capronia epimyces CBS 606.96]EXJ93127.1 hypothetical protein A1O3_01684 [Capronia epimyces CBS 606.96]
MIPKAALIVLIAVVAVATITFLIAIYDAISSHLQSRRLRKDERSNESTLPLTRAATVPGMAPAPIPTTELLPTDRTPTPEAEFPPPLSVEWEDLAEAESPPPLPRQRDSMHEIIDLYTTEARNLPPGPKSAPARITTFAQADSKWAYFGAKRAEYNVV